MPTSSYMPNITCHVAWDGGLRVPMADWTWTDVSDSVELDAGISASGGRGDERSTADANTLTLTLDNSEGHFTAGRVTGDYYPNVVLYKPIRLTIDPVDGAAITLLGYITSWPVEWNETSAYAKATITATSRLARLGLNAQWRSLIEETLLYDSPVAYYSLGEPAGATQAADVSGNGVAPLTMAGTGTAVDFGTATGPGTDDLTAATFAGGQYLLGSIASTATTITVETFVVRSGLPASDETVLAIASTALCIKTDGHLAVGAVGSLVSSSSPSSVADGSVHHVVAVIDRSAFTVEVFIDGVSAITDGTSMTTGEVGAVYVAGGQSYAGSPVALSGSLAHVAVYDYALSSTQIAAHATAGTTGWAGDTTDARLDRYAELAGISSVEVAAEASAVTMVHIDTTGQSIVDLLRACETTEGGVLFDALDGTLTMHNRSHRYDIAASFTLDMAQDHVEADYQPRLDPSSLVNDATVTSTVTTARRTDPDSIEANGVATASITIHDEDPDAPARRAGWTIHKYADPKTRVPSLTVDALAQVGKTPNCAAILNATVGDKISVANHPAQAAYSIVDYFIEGWSFDIGPERFRVTWNLSPSSPEDTVLILDSPSRGLLDTNVLAF